MLPPYYEENAKLKKLLNDKTEQVKNLLHFIADLERELMGEKELRKKSENYTKEVEGYLKETINKEDEKWYPGK